MKPDEPSLEELLDAGANWLEHFGVKGMRWGVRRSMDTAGPDVRTEGVDVKSDGSISIRPGASIQRLIRSNGGSMPMKDITFASINEYDNAKYIKEIGGKGFFGGGRDQILSIVATKPIKAPSHAESVKLHSELLLSDAKYRAKLKPLLGEVISKKELEKVRSDPSGKAAQEWYKSANQAMTFDKEFDPGAPYVQKALKDHIEKNGYNALRDENDFGVISKAPIIIFSPEKSLKVVKVTNITDELRQANKEKLKQYKAKGKKWIDQELYS